MDNMPRVRHSGPASAAFAATDMDIMHINVKRTAGDVTIRFISDFPLFKLVYKDGSGEAGPSVSKSGGFAHA